MCAARLVTVVVSVSEVWFSLVQGPLALNLELNLHTTSLNRTEPWTEPSERVRQVWSRFEPGEPSNLEWLYRRC